MGGGGQCAEGEEEFERGHGGSLSWSCADFINSMKRFSKLQKRHDAGKCQERMVTSRKSESML